MFKHKAAMLRGFDRFVSGVNAAYAQARAALERDDYIDAQRILAGIAVRHAKASLSLRNVLVKNGKLEEDK